MPAHNWHVQRRRVINHNQSDFEWGSRLAGRLRQVARRGTADMMARGGTHEQSRPSFAIRHQAHCIPCTRPGNGRLRI